METDELPAEGPAKEVYYDEPAEESYSIDQPYAEDSQQKESGDMLEMAAFELGAREIRESGPSHKRSKTDGAGKTGGIDAILAQAKNRGEIDIEEDLELDEEEAVVNYQKDEDVLLDGPDEDGYEEFDDIDI